MTAGEPAHQVWSCGSCGMGDLECMNRVVMDRVRCCQRCNGHAIPVTEKGRQFMVDSGVADGDGITLMLLTVALQRREQRGG